MNATSLRLAALPFSAVEKPDHRHRRLLRARRHRPRRRAAQQRGELAPIDVTELHPLALT